jgi:hypothetical protein
VVNTPVNSSMRRRVKATHNSKVKATHNSKVKATNSKAKATHNSSLTAMAHLLQAHPAVSDSPHIDRLRARRSLTSDMAL